MDPQNAPPSATFHRRQRDIRPQTEHSHFRAFVDAFPFDKFHERLSRFLPMSVSSVTMEDARAMIVRMTVAVSVMVMVMLVIMAVIAGGCFFLL